MRAPKALTGEAYSIIIGNPSWLHFYGSKESVCKFVTILTDACQKYDFPVFFSFWGLQKALRPTTVRTPPKSTGMVERYLIEKLYEHFEKEKTDNSSFLLYLLPFTVV